MLYLKGHDCKFLCGCTICRWPLISVCDFWTVRTPHFAILCPISIFILIFHSWECFNKIMFQFSVLLNTFNLLNRGGMWCSNIILFHIYHISLTHCPPPTLITPSNGILWSNVFSLSANNNTEIWLHHMTPLTSATPLQLLSYYYYHLLIYKPW